MHSEPAVSPKIFLRSREWLLSLPQVYGEDLESGLKVLVGSWICERAVGLHSEEFIALAKGIHQRLLAMPEMETIVSLDSNLWLLSYLALQREHLDVPLMTDMCKSLSAELLSLEDIPLRYSGEAILLAQLENWVLRKPSVEAGTRKIREIMVSNADGLRQVSADIAGATRYGAAPLCGMSRREYRSVLIGVMVARLRRYDLELGSTLLRSVRYAGLGKDRSVLDAVAFLRDQQCENGSFGHFAAEVRTLTKSLEAKQRYQLGADASIGGLLLPVTLSCLWTLAESYIPGFLLFYPNGV